MEAESRPAAWVRDFRLSGFALSVLLLIVAALVVLAPGLKTFVEQRQQIAQLEQDVAESSDAVDDLEDQVDRWSDPAYIESQARGRLYYVFPGDVSYLIVGGEEPVEVPDAQPISADIQTTRVDWVQSFVGSLYAAGLTDAPAAELPAPVQPTPPTGDGQ